MKEKLVIKNFGPIKSVELELGRFNVLIGEQATGKSTVAKVLAMCKYFSYIIKNDLDDQLFREGLISWGLNEAVQDGTYIHYDCRHYTFIIERNLFPIENSGNKDTLAAFMSTLVPKSTEFKGLLKELDKLKPGHATYSFSGSPGLILPTSFFQNDVARVMENPFYLPAERGLQSLFSLGKSSIQNISDSLFNQFAQLDHISRQFGLETEIEPLDIVYKNEQGKGYIRKKNEESFYSLYNAATGYQSTIPVVLSFRYYTEMRKKKKSFIIEEPEQDIYPSAQQRLVQFMVDSVVNSQNTVLLTTHSPYTLTSLNNMMYAYQIGKSHGQITEKIIKKKYWINPQDVSAYMLLPDGTFEDVFDREEGLIKADKIDGVSGKLNEQFNALLNIELEEK